MAITLYSATVPTFLQVLGSVSSLLDTAAAWCSENGLPESELIGARLADDMWPFSWQVRAAWAHSADAVDGVFQGEYTPDFSEPPQTFAGLKENVEGAIARLGTVNPAQLDALEGNDACFRFGERRMDFTAEDYLLSFAQPNFFFHATCAYAILRAKGLPLGKKDFIGGLRMKR
jgi:uncharacterized protein